jgi:hypothetical protein
VKDIAIFALQKGELLNAISAISVLLFMAVIKYMPNFPMVRESGRPAS